MKKIMRVYGHNVKKIRVSRLEINKKLLFY